MINFSIRPQAVCIRQQAVERVRKMPRKFEGFDLDCVTLRSTRRLVPEKMNRDPGSSTQLICARSVVNCIEIVIIRTRLFDSEENIFSSWLERGSRHG